MSSNSRLASLSLESIRRLHFVGIGGSGMNGLADIALHQGFSVSGSDLVTTSVTQRLAQRGAQIFQGHAAHHIQGAELLIVSSAVQADNIELQAATEVGLTVLQRAEFLALLMRRYRGIAVAGTHGKTTTTSLVTSLLSEAGFDPSCVIGGRLNSLGSHAHLGLGSFFVAEADESDASFLWLQPEITIVTNIDADHLSTYGGDFSGLRQAFADYINQLPPTGLAVLCLEDENIRAIHADCQVPVITYGFDAAADWRAIEVSFEGTRSHFQVMGPALTKPLPITLNMPGEHNVLNALAAIAVAFHCHASDLAVQHALMKFSGVGRRFQVHGNLEFANGMATLVDDYGHHPTELNATIQAAKSAWPERRLVMVFQPHRYTRTQELWAEFASVLSQVEALILLEIYSAGEAPIPGISSSALQQYLSEQYGKMSELITESRQLSSFLETFIAADDVVLFQGAGNIGQMALDLAASAAVRPVNLKVA